MNEKKLFFSHPRRAETGTLSLNLVLEHDNTPVIAQNFNRRFVFRADAERFIVDFDGMVVVNCSDNKTVFCDIAVDFLVAIEFCKFFLKEFRTKHVDYSHILTSLLYP